MSQDLVFDFLKLQRLTGELKFWRKYEIRNKLIDLGWISPKQSLSQIGRMVNKLYAHNFLEIYQDEKCFFVQSFRIKEKYLKVCEPGDVNVWFKE